MIFTSASYLLGLQPWPLCPGFKFSTTLAFELRETKALLSLSHWGMFINTLKNTISDKYSFVHFYTPSITAYSSILNYFKVESIEKVTFCRVKHVKCTLWKRSFPKESIMRNYILKGKAHSFSQRIGFCHCKWRLHISV